MPKGSLLYVKKAMLKYIVDFYTFRLELTPRKSSRMLEFTSHAMMRYRIFFVRGLFRGSSSMLIRPGKQETGAEINRQVDPKEQGR